MRVAVTGWSWRTALGSGIEQVVDRLLDGGQAPVDRSVALPAGCPALARAPIGAAMTSRRSRLVGLGGLHAMDCAREAACGTALPREERLGLFAATAGLRVSWQDTLPALAEQRLDGVGAWARGLRALHPFWLLRHLSNVMHAELAIELGARGEGATLGGWTAGAQAIAAAAAALEAGAVDAALVVAHDSLLEPEALVELAATLPRVAPHEPGAGEASGPVADGAALVGAAPYAERAGRLVAGEAAAALVLEHPARAADRALAWIEAADGADGAPFAPEPATIHAVLGRLLGGETPESRVADRTGHPTALRGAGARGAWIVDGAALGDLRFDAAERGCVAQWLGADSALIALQAAFGQLGATTALVQTIALAALLRRGQLPAIVGLGAAAPGPLRPLVRRERTGARRALALGVAPPGLIGIVRVEVA